MPLHLIKTPSEIDLAWAEHAERERILSAYRGAATRADATAVRWEAYEYDLANPGTSPLVAELDGHEAAAISREARADLDTHYGIAVRKGNKGRIRFIEALAADIDVHDRHGRPSLLARLRHNHPTAA